ncbi:unnamed protein product [Caenorhabditis auriculariae]|uniref:Uncharacterized protein n=1 Tax=Caenorhabditis auriculariae TaxID=2777116 RepID=A0A8S1HSU3_9PELO|nr:unnamed protein product [Caenorhabditis auriculariae]
MYTRAAFLLIPAIVFAAPSPVSVQIDNPEAVDVGSYDRARFSLTESFQPLHAASAANEDQVQAALRQRVAGVKNNEATIEIALPTVEVSNESQRNVPERLAFGEWTEWTAWSQCQNGEKSRVRTCVSRRLALRVVCHGESIEIQKCFVSASNNSIPVAKDPWTIEREISGDFRA